MNEKRYKKRLEFQEKIISRKSEEIESLKLKIKTLELESKAKDELINSVEPLRKELTENINEIKKYKNEYKELIKELKDMKNTLNQSVYKGRWNLVKFLIK